MSKSKALANKLWLPRVLRRVKGYSVGRGCRCASYDRGDCGCDVDWRSKQEIAALAALDYCLTALKARHASTPGIVDLIRDTESIIEAGEYRPRPRMETVT
jgi:hypothetical protein